MSFCIIIFVPVLLAGITLWGFGKVQSKILYQAFDVNTSPYEYLLNSIRMMNSERGHVSKE